MIERILVPTDGSPESAQAVPIATQIARAQGADILLMQVVSYPIVTDQYETMLTYDLYQQVLDAAEEDAKSNLGRLEAEVQGHGVRATTIQVNGSPAALLIDAEREQKIDLVVMATHGRSGLARFALGSVADRMLREGTRPVLLARSTDSEPTLKTALLMLDGSGVSEEAVPVVKTLAGRPIENVKLFRAVDDLSDRTSARTYLEGVAGHLAGEGLNIETAVDVGDPTMLVRRAAQDTDLVILCTHGRGGFDRFRHGSVAERVVREVDKPVLLIRAGAVAAIQQTGTVRSGVTA
jgi:nucleotide-binding universal stress UspA family protein